MQPNELETDATQLDATFKRMVLEALEAGGSLRDAAEHAGITEGHLLSMIAAGNRGAYPFVSFAKEVASAMEHAPGELRTITKKERATMNDFRRTNQGAVAQGPGGVTARFVNVTPDVARELLDRNTNNRSIRLAKLRSWTNALTSGRWMLNGDAIRLSRSGVLLDGQHRLRAVIESKITVVMLLVEGLDDRVFSTIDSGARRSGADALAREGKKNSHALSATLAFIHRYFKGTPGYTMALQPDEILGLLSEYPEAEESVGFTGKAHRLMSPAALAGLHYLFSLVDRSAANRFVEDMKSGAGLEENDGVYQLRERLIRDRQSKSKLPDREVIAIAIKAWNARRDNRSVRTLSWRHHAGEKFPKIRGLDDE